MGELPFYLKEQSSQKKLQPWHGTRRNHLDAWDQTRDMSQKFSQLSNCCHTDKGNQTWLFLFCIKNIKRKSKKNSNCCQLFSSARYHWTFPLTKNCIQFQQSWKFIIYLNNQSGVKSIISQPKLIVLHNSNAKSKGWKHEWSLHQSFSLLSFMPVICSKCKCCCIYFICHLHGNASACLFNVT